MSWFLPIQWQFSDPSGAIYSNGFPRCPATGRNARPTAKNESEEPREQNLIVRNGLDRSGAMS